MLICCHVEYGRWCFAWVVDDVVIDVVIVDDVRDVASTLVLSLDSLLSRIQV